MEQTLDRYTMAGIPECLIGRMTGPLQETTQDRTQIKDPYPVSLQKLTFFDPIRNRTRAVGLEGRESTYNATRTEKIIKF